MSSGVCSFGKAAECDSNVITRGINAFDWNIPVLLEIVLPDLHKYWYNEYG